MAYLVSRPAGRYEIRESRQTAAGPRSRQLARFADMLTIDVLDAARHAASRPFDESALCERARAMGIPVQRRSDEPEARALLARLRRADRLAPEWVELIDQALASLPRQELPEHLAEASEWIGEPPDLRGRTLFDLLDTYGRIAESRDLPRAHAPKPFPRFSSVRTQAAS